MSELKAYIAYEADDFPDETEFYLKSEADKVIAELKDNLKVQISIAEEGWNEGWKMAGIYHSSYVESVLELYEKNKEIRRQKYKWCLAMARWCMVRYNEWAAYYPTTTTRKMMFLHKWHKRWLAIADKFKEAK